MKKFRYIAVAALALCMALALAGCGSAYTPDGGKSPTVTTPTIGVSGKLRVGVDTGNPPLAGQASKVIGIDVDIASAIADELGLKVEIVDVGSDGVTALNESKVDIVMGIDSLNSDAALWKSKSYLPTAVALFATEEGAAVPAAGDGSKIAAQSNSMSSWTVTNEFGADSLDQQSDLSSAFELLKAGTVKYVAADAIIGSYAANTSGVKARIVALMQQPSGYSIAALASNAELTKLIESTLQKLTDNGIVGIIESKWLGSELSLSSVPFTAGVKVTPAADANDPNAAANANGAATPAA